jgi:hypothetical protein
MQKWERFLPEVLCLETPSFRAGENLYPPKLSLVGNRFHVPVFVSPS